jgi:hypothetical protein
VDQRGELFRASTHRSRAGKLVTLRRDPLVARRQHPTPASVRRVCAMRLWPGRAERATRRRVTKFVGISFIVAGTSPARRKAWDMLSTCSRVIDWRSASQPSCRRPTLA